MDKIHLHIFGSKIFFNLIEELDSEYNLIFKENKILKIEDNTFNNSINVIFAENITSIELNVFVKKNIPSIFLVSNKNFFPKNKLSILDFHIILELPIDLLSFKEILKILIIKYNFFKKSKVMINNYEIDSNQRIISKNNIKTKLTEKELKLILALYEKNGIHKSVLLKKIWNYNSNLDSHAFETNLYRLREKIEKTFNDKKFILEKNSLYYLNRL
jgi:hypothetical protein